MVLAQAVARMSLAPVGSDRLVAQPRPFAVSRGAVAVCACALALAGSKFRLAESIEELGGTIVHRRGGVMDPCSV